MTNVCSRSLTYLPNLNDNYCAIIDKKVHKSIWKVCMGRYLSPQRTGGYYSPDKSVCSSGTLPLAASRMFLGFWDFIKTKVDHLSHDGLAGGKEVCWGSGGLLLKVQALLSQV